MQDIGRKQNLERLKGADISSDNIWYLHYKSFHEDLTAALEKYASGKLLDIGCGNKPYSEIVSPFITKYVGCDIIQSSNQCVEILCPANQIPLPDGSFDTILSTQTIEHVEDHQGLLNEAFRLLRPGGFLIISGPLYWPLHEEPYDFFRFTKYGFTHLIEKSGFQMISIKSNGGKWSVAGQALLHALVPDLEKVKSFKGKIIRKIFNLAGGIRTFNRVFLHLDSKNTDYTNTMNYVVVAQKSK
jgi:SAM-dependent methyltransferase